MNGSNIKNLNLRSSTTERTVHLEPAWQRIAILVVLLSGPCFLALVFTVIPPVLPSIAGHFGGGSAGQLVAQLVMTLPSIGLMIGGPLNGWLIDRYGARRLLFIALAAYGFLGSAGFYLDSQWTLLTTRFLLGFASSGLVTAAATMIGSRFESVMRARLLGYGTFFGAGGGLLSILLAGVIAEKSGWHAPFMLYLSALAVLLLALIALPDASKAAQSEQDPASPNHFAILALAPVYVAITLTFIAVFMTNAQVSFLLVADGITNPSMQAQIIGMASLSNGVGGIAYGWLRSRMELERIYVLVLAMLAVGIGIIGLSHGPLAAAVGCAITGFGGGVAVPYFLNMVIDKAEVDVRSRALGFAYSAIFLGDFLNPFIMTPATSITGIHGAFLTVAALLASSALYKVVRRQPR